MTATRVRPSSGKKGPRPGKGRRKSAPKTRETARPKGSPRQVLSRATTRVPRRHLRTVGWIVLAVMLLAGALAIALWQVPALRVATVEYRTSPERTAALQEAAPVRLGQPLVEVDTEDVRRDALATRLFSSVEVSRSWPSTLVVEATPRTPAVAVRSSGAAGVALVDATGTSYETVSKAPDGVPVASAAEPEDPTALRALATVVAGLPKDVVTQVDDLGIDESRMISMTLGKVAVNWGDAGDSRLKTAVVRDLLDRPDVARIDVTAPMAPVTSTHREPSTWTPAESASRGPSGSPSAPDATAGTETSP